MLTYCGFKSLLNYGVPAPSLTFLISISLTFNTFAKRLCKQPGSRGSSHMPHMYRYMYLKEVKVGLKFCHGWGYGPVFPWTSSCLFPAVTRYGTLHVRNVLCKSTTSDEKLFCTPNYEQTLLESCTKPHHPPWCWLLILCNQTKGFY